MFSKKPSVRSGVVVGIAGPLVAGLLVSIGVVQAAGADRVVAAIPAAEAPSPFETSGAPAAARSAASVSPAAGVNGSLAAVNRLEPTRRMREKAPVALDRLVLVGDSLAAATAPVIRYVTPGKAFATKFMGGTAPCDWTDVDLDATPTTVVVITFTGNNLTPCMLDEAGAGLIDLQLVDRYRTDVGVLIDHATAAGAWVVLVGQPVRHPRFDADVEVEGINAVYRQYAETMERVSYVDAGRFVETPDGLYTDRLPCTDLDTDCAADGTTVVRGDGVHFCPVVDAVPCPVWSSGAVRFGLGIAAAANDPASFD